MGSNLPSDNLYDFMNMMDGVGNNTGYIANVIAYPKKILAAYPNMGYKPCCLPHFGVGNNIARDHLLYPIDVTLSLERMNMYGLERNVQKAFLSWYFIIPILCCR